VDTVGTSGKRVVAVLLGLVLAAGLIAWLGATQLEKKTRADRNTGPESSGAMVVSEGVLFEARMGEPGIVIAKEVGSGKELWRAELGSVTGKPVLLVRDEIVEVQIAGTPWMTLDRSTGEPLE